MNDRLRIGDAEREAAAHELGEHFAMGRITAEEHGERLEQIWSARTAADLAPAFSDLPRPRPAQPPPPPRSHGDRMRDWLPALPRMPFLFKALLAIVVVALVVTHLPLLVLALLVYVFGVRRLAHKRRYHTRWR